MNALLSARFAREKPAAPMPCAPLVLNQRCVAIKPTGRGFGLLLTVALLFLLAVNYNNNQIYLLTFLLASVFCVAMLQTYRNLAGLIVQIGPPQPVFVGEKASMALTLGNAGPEPRLGLCVKLAGEQVFGLGARQQKILLLPFSSRRRGWQNFGTVMLKSCYPLGIFQAQCALLFSGKVLVYPAPSRVELPMPHGPGAQAGGRGNDEQGGQDDFDGIRPYQVGDSLRRIHWQSYAKGHGLLSKQFSSEVGGDTIWLSLENAPGTDLEARLSQLCRWVLDADVAGYRYGLVLPGKMLTPACGLEHRAACLEALATA